MASDRQEKSTSGVNVKLLAAVDLPRLTVDGEPDQAAVKPVSLGTFAVDPKYICLPRLLGDPDERQVVRLACRSVGDPLTARQWDVVVAKGSDVATAPSLGRLTVREDKLFFAWDATAAPQPAAPQLRNCILQMAVGQHTHRVALRRTQVMAPLDLSDEPTQLRWDVADLPPPNRLRLECRLDSRTRMRPRFVGSSTLKSTGNETWLDFDPQHDECGFLVRVKATFGTAIRITAKPYFQVATLPRRRQWNERQVEQLHKSLTAAQQQLQAQRKLLGQMGGRPGNALSKDQARVAEAVRGAMTKKADAQLQQVGSALAQVRSLQTTARELKKGASLKLRLYIEVDGEFLDLVTTSPAAAGKPSRKK